LGEALERFVVAAGRLVAVDGKDHTSTTVVTLTAVSPDGGGVVDGKVPGGEAGGISGNGEEARVESELVVDVGATAGIGEERLSDGVVLLTELEDDGVPGLRADARGVERELAWSTNNDLDDVALKRSGGWRGRVGVRGVGRGPGGCRELDDLGDWGRNRGGRDGHAAVRRSSPGSGSSSGRVVVPPTVTARSTAITASVTGGGSRGRGLSLEALAYSEGRILEVAEGVGRSVEAAVDGEDHASTAMAVGGLSSLFAVDPGRLGIVHGQGPGREILGDVSSHRHEARVKATLLLATGLRERRLGHGVVLGVKVEDNLIACLRGDCFRRKGEAIGTNLNFMDCRRNKGKEGKSQSRNGG